LETPAGDEPLEDHNLIIPHAGGMNMNEECPVPESPIPECLIVQEESPTVNDVLSVKEMLESQQMKSCMFDAAYNDTEMFNKD
jgi:hypothetical protein